MIGPTNATAVYAQIDPSIATNVGSATQPVFVSNSTIVPANTMVDTITEQTIPAIKNFDITPRGLRFISTTSGYKEAFKIPVSNDLSSVTCYLVGRVIDKSYARTATFILALRTSNYTPMLYVSAPIPALFCTLNADYSVSLWISDQRVVLYADTLTRGNYASEFRINQYVQTSTVNLQAKPAEGDDYLQVVDSAIMPDLIDKDALDGYAPMLRTANNQDFEGVKTALGLAATSSTVASPFGAIRKITNYDVTQILSTGNRYFFGPTVVDQNGKIIMGLRIQAASSGSGRLIFTLVTTKTDGTLAFHTLAEYNQSSDTWS